MHVLVAVFALLSLTIRKPLRSPLLFYPLTVVVCLLSIDFMTISLTSYNPVCEDPRHILLFGPILVVCTVQCIRSGYIHLRPRRSSATLFLVVAFIATCATLLPTLQLARYGPTLGYRDVKTAFRQLYRDSPTPAIYYGSEVTKNLGNYLSDFSGGAAGVSFLPLDRLPACPLPPGDTTRYLLQNWYTDWHAQLDQQDFDKAIANRSLQRYPAPTTVEGLQITLLNCE